MNSAVDDAHSWSQWQVEPAKYFQCNSCECSTQICLTGKGRYTKQFKMTLQVYEGHHLQLASGIVTSTSRLICKTPAHDGGIISAKENWINIAILCRHLTMVWKCCRHSSLDSWLRNWWQISLPVYCPIYWVSPSSDSRQKIPKDILTEGIQIERIGIALFCWHYASPLATPPAAYE